MKLALIIFLISISYVGISQNTDDKVDRFVTIIDKSEETKSIFDYNNPLSLVSIVSQNFDKGYHVLEFDRVKSENPEVKFNVFIVDRIDELGNPLLKLDPNTGEPLIVRNPNTGVDEFFIVEPDTVNFDFTDISRVLIFQEQSKNIKGEIITEIKDVVFAKKYPKSKKYDMVFEISYEKLRKMHGFKIFSKIPQNETDKLINDTNSFYFQWNKLNRGSKKSLPKIKLKDDSLALVKSTIPKYDYIESKVNRDFYLFNIHNTFPKQFIYFEDNKDFIAKNYSIENFNYQPRDAQGFPLIELDPVTGEELYEINPKTKKLEPKIVNEINEISYIYNDNPNFYVQNEFIYDTLNKVNSNAYIQSVYVTKYEPSLNGEVITLKYNLYKKGNKKWKYGFNLSFDPIIDKYFINNYIDNLSCFKVLDSCIQKSKKLNLNNFEDIKFISDSFYDYYGFRY